MDYSINYIIFCLIVIIFFILLYCFHKIRNIHIMVYKIKDDVGERSKKELLNFWRQLENLEALRSELNFSKSLPVTRGWAASPDFLHLLSRYVVAQRPSTIVECGSGSTTVVLARCAANVGRGHVYSLEHDPDFAESTRQELNRHQLQDWATIIDAPLVNHNIKKESWVWYDVKGLESISKIDLLVIDGPPFWVGELARYPAGPLFFPKIPSDSIIFLDDADRTEEVKIVNRWIFEFPQMYKKRFETEKGCIALSKNEKYLKEI